jgi:hypothetical protein
VSKHALDVVVALLKLLLLASLPLLVALVFRGQISFIGPCPEVRQPVL